MCGKDSTNGEMKETTIKKSFLNLSISVFHAEIVKSRKFGNPPTYSSMVNHICGAILNITKNFKYGKISKALSKQSIIEGLLKSGFSPTVQSNTWLYETLEKFNN